MIVILLFSIHTNIGAQKKYASNKGIASITIIITRYCPDYIFKWHKLMSVLPYHIA